MPSLSPSPCSAASPTITAASTTEAYQVPSPTSKFAFGTTNSPYSISNERQEGVRHPLTYEKIYPRPLHQARALTPRSQAPSGFSSQSTLEQSTTTPQTLFSVSRSCSLGRSTSTYDLQSPSYPTPSLVPAPSVYPSESLIQQPMSPQSYSRIAHPPQPSIRLSSGAWNPADDKTLIAARAKGMNWAPIQQYYFPSKTPNACRKRHERLLEKRNAGDWDEKKLENLAKHYMAMRRDIWAPLATRIGEKWNVIEQKCMSQGLKSLQSSARSYARQERLLGTDSVDYSNISQPIMAGAFGHAIGDTGDSAYGDEMEIESDAGMVGMYGDQEKAESNQQRIGLSSIDLGIDAIISRRAVDFNNRHGHCVEDSSARTTDNPFDATTRTLSQSKIVAKSSDSRRLTSVQLGVSPAVQQYDGQLPTISGTSKEVFSVSIQPQRENKTIGVQVEERNVTQISIHEPSTVGDPLMYPDPHQSSQPRCQRASEDFQETKDLNDDDRSLVSWEDQPSLRDSAVHI